jgi:hypothetical protein
MNKQLERIITQWIQEKMTARNIDTETARREIVFALGVLLTSPPEEVIPGVVDVAEGMK